MLIKNIKNKINPEKVWDLYGEHERKISSMFLFGGFVVDWLTLKRVDNLWENIWIIGLIFFIALFIVLINHAESKRDESSKDRVFWYTNILQFFLGGILSAFLVFYFRSAELSTSWPFIFVLIFIFIANEYLKKYLSILTFQLSLLFFSLFCGSIFLIPVFIHKIGPGIFIISGFFSLFIMILFLQVFVRFGRDRFYENRKKVLYSVLGIFFVMNILYFTNLIPPIPISLKNSGVYHSIVKTSSGEYIAKFEDFGWRENLQIYKLFHLNSSESVYIYSSVFSPSSFNLTVLHEWQHYDEKERRWLDVGRIDLPIVGGRDGGFRTYSTKNNLSSGFWRVNVLTQNGQVIGRLRFEVVVVEKSPVLSTKVLE